MPDCDGILRRDEVCKRSIKKAKSSKVRGVAPVFKVCGGVVVIREGCYVIWRVQIMNI